MLCIMSRSNPFKIDWNLFWRSISVFTRFFLQKLHYTTLSPCLSVLDFLRCLFHEIWFLNSIFCLFQTWFLQATQTVKIKFEIYKISSWKIKLKNQFCEIEILKNQVQIGKGVPQLWIKWNISQKQLKIHQLFQDLILTPATGSIIQLVPVLNTTYHAKSAFRSFRTSYSGNINVPLEFQFLSPHCVQYSTQFPALHRGWKGPFNKISKNIFLKGFL